MKAITSTNGFNYCVPNETDVVINENIVRQIAPSVNKFGGDEISLFNKFAELFPLMNGEVLNSIKFCIEFRGYDLDTIFINKPKVNVSQYQFDLEDWHTIQDYAINNNIINAVKTIRDITGWTLMESKLFFEKNFRKTEYNIYGVDDDTWGKILSLVQNNQIQAIKLLRNNTTIEEYTTLSGAKAVTDKFKIK